jgi:group I intron endonuclease
MFWSDFVSNNESKWSVYIHKNLINGKVYVGITSRAPEKRWGKDGNGYKRHPYFWNAIKKYGWHNFEHQVLLQNETFEYACQAEKCLIKHYKSNNRQYGYNDTSGGEGRLLTDEQKKALSEQRRGENNAFYGKHHTDETKNRLRESNSGRSITERQSECLQLGRGNWTQERREKLSNVRKGEGSPTSKLAENDVIAILKMIQQHKPYSEIKNKYQVSDATISSIKNKKRWTYLYEKYPDLYF